MTERNVSGNAVRSRHAQARKVAAEKGLSPEVMEILAEGVREFDAQRSTEQRSAAALEALAAFFTSAHRGGDGLERWEWEEKRLRRREVYALELAAVAFMSDDVGDDALVAIRKTAAFKRLMTRLSSANPDVDSVVT